MASAEIEFRCFVGGLAWATHNEVLERAFAPFGKNIESKVLFAGSLVKNDKVIHDALIEAMSKKATIVECIEAIETAA